jgi:hypothetical protein
MSLRANLMLLLVCAALPAQVAEKPLTNTDVASMLRAGLPDGTVILAIQRAVDRGNTKFDVSTSGLIELRNSGATEDVMNTILLAPNIPPYEPSTTVPGLPMPHGLYYQSGANWSSLDSVLLWPNTRTQFKTNWKAPWGFDNARETRHYVLAGRQAGVRVTGSRPAFYLRGERPEKGWWILPLASGADHREAVARIPDALAHQPTMSFQFGEPVKLEPTAAAADVLTLRPAADLSPGEYLVFRWVPGQPWLIEAYPFDVGTT